MRPDIHLQIDRLVLDGHPSTGSIPARWLRRPAAGLLADQGIHEGLAPGGAERHSRWDDSAPGAVRPKATPPCDPRGSDRQRRRPS